jgi:hypothetical protein
LARKPFDKDLLSRRYGNVTVAIPSGFMLVISDSCHKKSFENVSEMKHLGTTITDRKEVRDEIRRRSNSQNVRYLYHCYYSIYLPKH